MIDDLQFNNKFLFFQTADGTLKNLHFKSQTIANSRSTADCTKFNRFLSTKHWMII